MAGAKVSLSKSRFCYGIQCPKQLWWRVHEPNAQELVPAPGLQAVFERGHLVGELACARFPGGVLIDGDYWGLAGRIERTGVALTTGAPAIFEAAFRTDGVFAAVDVLERRGAGFVLVEVKSTLGVKEPHLLDVAIQLHVLRAAGLQVKRAEVMHLNRECTFPDLSDLLVRSNITADVRKLLGGIPGQIQELQQVLAGQLPDTEPGDRCTKPYECPFFARCNPPLPEHHVTTIHRLGSKRAAALLGQGIETIYELPDDVRLSAVATRQVLSVKKGTPIAEPGLADALAALETPIACLDFETINPAVPVWDGCHPYEIIAVQMSCHVLDGAGRAKHHEHLAEGSGDPRPAMADAVVRACKGAQTVLAYNASFERTRIEALASAVPARRVELNRVIRRLVDLLPIVREHVYHPDFGGSFSLKNVLPALVPSLGYDDLDIQDGGTASEVLESLLLQEGSVPVHDRQALRRQLLAYCGRDTLALVMLLKELWAMAKTAPRDRASKR